MPSVRALSDDPDNLGTRVRTVLPARGVPLTRIPETDVRTPDYEITLDQQRIVVEVKETSPETQKSVSRNGSSNSVAMDSRLEGDARRSGSKDDLLRVASTQGEVGGIYQRSWSSSIRGRVVGHVEGYHVRVAMYGLEQIHIAVPPLRSGQPYATGASHGPKRKMTEVDNTISAIGALVKTGPNAHELLVYRNRFARVPIDRRCSSPSV